jgi:hypothetical protein
MIFGPKIACEQCNTKVKEAKSLYRRGSRFCSDACIATWEQANPPPVARGDETALRGELAMLLDEAFAENKRKVTPGLSADVGNVQVNVSLGGVDNIYAQDQARTARELFQTYALRSAPVLRALGFAREATMIDSTDFTQGHGSGLVDALRAVRKQL